jgi:hypothetical protein
MRRVLAHIAAVLATAVVSACDSVTGPSTSTLPGADTNPVFAMSVNDPGRLHNEVVRAYAARRPLGGPAVTRADFVRTIVAASNEAFAAEGLPPVIEARDVDRVLSMIYELRRAGVFDFFSTKTGDPGAIIDYWEAKGIVTAADAAEARGRLGLGTSAPHRSSPAVEPESGAMKVFDSVYVASRDLWTHRRAENNLKRAGTGPKLLTRDETMFELDAIGTLFGWWLGGPAGGTFGGILFSVAFIEVPPDGGGGWDCSDYCNMG